MQSLLFTVVFSVVEFRVPLALNPGRLDFGWVPGNFCCRRVGLMHMFPNLWNMIHMPLNISSLICRHPPHPPKIKMGVAPYNHGQPRFTCTP